MLIFLFIFCGSFFGSVGFVWRFIRRCLIEDYFTIVCLMAVIRCVRVWRASGYRHHSRNRTQIPTRANKTKCDNKRGRGTRWAAMSLSHSLSGALHGVWEEQEHGTTEMLSYLCHAALWCGSGSCSVCVCVCVCVLGNPVEMKGAATHWPGDYGITFVIVPGLDCWNTH